MVKIENTENAAMDSIFGKRLQGVPPKEHSVKKRKAP